MNECHGICAKWGSHTRKYYAYVHCTCIPSVQQHHNHHHHHHHHPARRITTDILNSIDSKQHLCYAMYQSAMNLLVCRQECA